MTSSSHHDSSTIKNPSGVETESSFTNPEEVDYESLPTTSVKVQLLAGAIAGIAEHTIVYPIDAIKVRFSLFLYKVAANPGLDSNAGC